MLVWVYSSQNTHADLFDHSNAKSQYFIITFSISLILSYIISYNIINSGFICFVSTVYLILNGYGVDHL